MKTQLTIEQSEVLLELGVGFERASKSAIAPKDFYNLKKPIEKCKLHSVFTLTDILDTLPREVKCEDLEIGFCGENWCAGYGEIMFFTAPELIDALFSLLARCLEKGYVK